MAALAFPALVALFLLAAIVAAAADRDEWHLEYGPAKPVSFTCATHLSALRANGFDGVLSIEHEDEAVGREEGFLMGKKYLEQFFIPGWC